MPGLGRRVFTPGEVLTATNVMGYLQDQAVMNFAGTAARGSAIGSAVSQGMVSYLDDTNSIEVYKTVGTAVAGWEPVNLAQSPNVVINGGFDISQRGTSYTITGSHFSYRTADRWILSCTASGSTSITNSIVSLPDGTAAIPNQELRFYMRSNVTTVGTATAYAYINRIEDVRTLAGKTATLSFWVRGTQSTTITPTLIQFFGTGGSSVVTLTGDTQSISSSWVRKTVTFNIPNVDSKTIVNADSFLQLQINVNSVTLGTLDIAGVQLEAGSTATPFRRNANSIQGELAACQRYYQRIFAPSSAPGNNTGLVLGFQQTLVVSRFVYYAPVVMRVAPSISMTAIDVSDDWSYATPPTAISTYPNNSSQTIYINVSHVSSGSQSRPVVLRSQFANNSFVEFNSEL